MKLLKLDMCSILSFGIAAIAALSPTAHAAAGGSSGGGGHWIESNFKTKTNAIVTEMSQWSSPAKAALKFSPTQILANLSIPGRFEPLCASGATLDFLISQQKMAYVGAPGQLTSVISLDCREERSQEWERLLSSAKSGDILFLLHEAVRNNNQSAESENDYGVSSSYLDGDAIETNAIKQTVFHLIFDDSRRKSCVVEIGRKAVINDNGCRFSGSCSVPYVGFVVSNNEVYRSGTLMYSGSGHSGTNSLFDINSPDFQISRKIYKLYVDFQCDKK